LNTDLIYMRAAIAQADKSLHEGGIPIGAALVIDDTLVGLGHNRRIQSGSPILHGETDCLQNAGRRTPLEYRQATLYTTLSPCIMCTGTILLYKIPRVVIGENSNFQGAERLLVQHGVEVINLEDNGIRETLRSYIERHPDIWFEDIGTTAQD
jgi:creatinine deaminase